MSINSDYQKLEPGNTVRLFEVDGTAFGVGDVLRFHAYNIPHTEAEIEATNPVSPIRLDDSKLDPRVTYTRAGAVSYIGQDGKIYQAAANQWLPDFHGGGIAGRTEPESASTNLFTQSATFQTWTAVSCIKSATGDALINGIPSTLITATATSAPRLRQTVASTPNGIYSASYIVKKGTTKYCHCTVERSGASEVGTVRFYIDLESGEYTATQLTGGVTLLNVDSYPIEGGWYLITASMQVTGMTGLSAYAGPASNMSSINANIGDSIYLAFAQFELNAIASSPIITTSASVTRPAASAKIPANGASAVRINYSTGESLSLSFGSATQVNIPVATKSWGSRYITSIEYVGGTPSYDESKLPAKSIWWQGIEYAAWPCQIEGIESSTTGSSAQPKLTVANLDGSITALCLAYDDMLQAKVSIHDTLAKYLDARNFPQGNTSADPTQEKLKVYYIDSKSVETKLQVEFTLSSPMDLQGLQIPTRQLHSLCTWCIRGKYRSGDGCDYAGTRYFDKFNKPVSDPSLDVCSGNLTGCKLRFGENNELSFGGFPGTSLLRT